MSTDGFLSLTDQVTALLRQGMLEGRWRETLPGRDRLARDLGVSHKTIEQAMRRLAKEGMLVSQGAGQRRRIVLPNTSATMSHLRVRILAYEPKDRSLGLCIELVEQLNRAGFTAAFATKALWDLNMNVKRVERFVRDTRADVWIVNGASREVLEWFCGQPTPAYSLFGIKSGLPIAGTGVRKDIAPLIRRLKELGHRRIVLLVRQEHVLPKPSFLARSFLEAMQGEEIATGPYNLPAWGHDPEGLHRCLHSLFSHTAPTAVICDEVHVFHAVRDHLAVKGIVAPRDVSLVCLDDDVSFSWCAPPVTRYTWDVAPIVRHVVRWTQDVARGKVNHRQTVCLAKLVEGGTIGPARK